MSSRRLVDIAERSRALCEASSDGVLGLFGTSQAKRGN